MCFPIEVKSSKSPKQYLSGRTMHQYEALRETGERCGLLPLYAYRLKGVRGDSWRIMRVEVESLTGKLRHLSRSIPKLPLTKNGTPHLDWQKGMPLHRFLSLVCRSDGARSIVEGSASIRLESIIESTN